MKYIVEFWNPWAGEWQRWNMEPVGKMDALDMAMDRWLIENTLARRLVEATN